jgi:hypothetical protein
MSDADRDDVEPTGEEAEAQREETVMPWIWGAIGVVVAALFLAWVIYWRPPTHHPKPAPLPPGVTQQKKPA